ncbi:hypothetical protein [Verrucomicrobium spinosum]|uniref:hypothetical protein n=1 Tax=Verrucomicrobium spinosum TaxID=2736 RepID=UPI0012E11196|nr:hypothetical protein [Verrucomicrobium spinosum]
MYTRLLKLSGILVLAAFGVAASFIPWGREDSLHGTRFPVFTVAWDRSKDTGLFLDYPNPLAYILLQAHNAPRMGGVFLNRTQEVSLNNMKPMNDTAEWLAEKQKAIQLGVA